MDGAGPGLWAGPPGLTLRTTDLTRLEVATKVLDPAVSLGSGATGEAATPARPCYLLRRGNPRVRLRPRVEPKGQARERVAFTYLEAVGLLQQAGVQWPDTHVPLGSEVQLGNRGQRFPGAQSTGGPAEGSREQALIPTDSLDPRNLPSAAQRVEGSQREPEPKLDLNPSFRHLIPHCLYSSHTGLLFVTSFVLLTFAFAVPSAWNAFPVLFGLINFHLAFRPPRREGMANDSSILARKIPLTEEPGGLQSVALQSQT